MSEFDDEVVCLITTPTALQAHIWENALREEGIHSQVVGDYLGLGFGDVFRGQAEIWVPRQEILRAHAILQRCSEPLAACRGESPECQPEDQP